MKYLKTLGLAAITAVALTALIGPAVVSATTLKVSGVTQAGSVEIGGTLEAGSKAILKDSAGTTTEECTASEFEGKTTTFSGATVSGPLSKFTFGGCAHTTKVTANGSLSISQIGSLADGTVISSGTEMTVLSTTFGVSAICKTGSGTDIGTLTGATNGGTNKTEYATLDINAKINCGILGTSTWTTSYIVSGPKELSVTG
jgi:hypothetical protein